MSFYILFKQFYLNIKSLSVTRFFFLILITPLLAGCLFQTPIRDFCEKVNKDDYDVLSNYVKTLAKDNKKSLTREDAKNCEELLWDLYDVKVASDVFDPHKKDVFLDNLMHKLEKFKADASPGDLSDRRRRTSRAALTANTEQKIALNFFLETYSGPFMNAFSNYFLGVLSEAGYLAVKLPNNVIISPEGAYLSVKYINAPVGSTEESMQNSYDAGTQYQDLMQNTDNSKSFTVDATIDTTSNAITPIELMHPSGDNYYWALINFQKDENDKFPVTDNGYILNTYYGFNFSVEHNYSQLYDIDMQYILAFGALKLGPISNTLVANDSRPDIFFLPDISSIYAEPDSPLEFTSTLCNCTGENRSISLSASEKSWNIKDFEFYKNGVQVDADNYPLTTAGSCPNDSSWFRCHGCSCESVEVKSQQNIGVHTAVSILTVNAQDKQNNEMKAVTQTNLIASHSSLLPYITSSHDETTFNLSWHGNSSTSANKLYYAPFDLQYIKHLLLGESSSLSAPLSGIPPLLLMLESCEEKSCNYSNLIAVP